MWGLSRGSWGHSASLGPHYGVVGTLGTPLWGHSASLGTPLWGSGTRCLQGTLGMWWPMGGFGELGGTVVCNGDVGFKLGVLGSKCLLGDPVWGTGDPEDPLPFRGPWRPHYGTLETLGTPLWGSGTLGTRRLHGGPLWVTQCLWGTFGSAEVAVASFWGSLETWGPRRPLGVAFWGASSGGKSSAAVLGCSGGCPWPHLGAADRGHPSSQPRGWHGAGSELLSLGSLSSEALNVTLVSN